MNEVENGAEGPEVPAGTVDPRLLEILVCPISKTTLEYDRERQELISRVAKLAYPIRQGVPIMLPDEARPLEDHELKRHVGHARAGTDGA